MLKKILSVTGYPRLAVQARELVETLESAPPTHAGSRLLEWLPPALHACARPRDALQLLDLCSDGAARVHRAYLRALMEAADDAPEFDLLRHGAAALAGLLRDACFQALRRAQADLQRHGPLSAWIDGLRHYLEWNSNALTLAYLARPAPQGCDWHKVYGLLAPAKRALDRPPAADAAHAALRAGLERALARLLLISRSLSPALAPRQVLIAAHLAELMHAHVALADEYGETTPYGTDIHGSDPPTLTGDTRPIGGDLRLFFGLDGALGELDHLEQRLLTQPALPDGLRLADGQGLAETQAAIRQLRGRWSGRRMVRQAPRVPLRREARLLHRFDLVHQSVSRRGGPIPTAISAEIEDVSATGYGLAVAGPATWADAAALVALRLPESPGWAIGVIRRRMPHTGGGVAVGVHLLSLEPRPARLVRVPDPVRAYEATTPTAAVFLPPGPLNGQRAGVLTAERLPDARYDCHVDGMGHAIRIDAQAVLEIGANFVLYVCQEGQGPAAAGTRDRHCSAS